MKKRYIAYIHEIQFSIELDPSELCTFVTHFGQFGNIDIYDQKTDERILTTVNTFIDSFYPDVDNRELAQVKARHLYDWFSDYKYQKKRKTVKGRLRVVFKEIIEKNS